MASETVSGQLRENHAEARDRVEDISTFDSWIDGSRYETDEVVETTDPVVGEPITAIPRCGSSEVDTAVDAAWRAFDEEWSETTPAERSRRMRLEDRDYTEDELVRAVEPIDPDEKWPDTDATDREE